MQDQKQGSYQIVNDVRAEDVTLGFLATRGVIDGSNVTVRMACVEVGHLTARVRVGLAPLLSLRHASVKGPENYRMAGK